MKVVIRAVGDSVVLDLPADYLSRSGLLVGQTVELEERGGALLIRPVAARITMHDILEAAPEDAHCLRVVGWDEMPSIGREV